MDVSLVGDRHVRPQLQQPVHHLPRRLVGADAVEGDIDVVERDALVDLLLADLVLDEADGVQLRLVLGLHGGLHVRVDLLTSHLAQ